MMLEAAFALWVYLIAFTTFMLVSLCLMIIELKKGLYTENMLLYILRISLHTPLNYQKTKGFSMFPWGCGKMPVA